MPGIGPWTAAEVMVRVLGDPDAVSVGDFHLPHLVSWALAGEARGTDERMLELLEPFRGQRARVIRLLELSGNPRTALRPADAAPVDRLDLTWLRHTRAAILTSGVRSRASTQPDQPLTATTRAQSPTRCTTWRSRLPASGVIGRDGSGWSQLCCPGAAARCVGIQPVGPAGTAASGRQTGCALTAGC